MHSRGGVNEMASYTQAVYGADAVGEMVLELARAAEIARARGCAAESIVLDPGLGSRSAPSTAWLHSRNSTGSLR